eukprot:Nitzschia sp. Nitz4//scaffold13_size275219//22564//24186//NITZ4_000839-RA/size275219-processed-gene-0.124-mRNA-1//-1//CDS//3329535909//675//frame0
MDPERATTTPSSEERTSLLDGQVDGTVSHGATLISQQPSRHRHTPSLGDQSLLDAVAVLLAPFPEDDDFTAFGQGDDDDGDDAEESASGYVSNKDASSSHQDDDDDDDDDGGDTYFSKLGSIPEKSPFIPTEDDEDMLVGEETLLGELIEEVHNIAEVVMEELQEVAAEEEAPFLEMGLARSLSLLPSDVVELANMLPQMVASAAEDQQDDSTGGDVWEVSDDGKMVDEVVRPPIAAYILLFVAAISLSAVGPLLDMQLNATSNMKATWRMLGTGIFLFPFAVSQFSKTGFPQLTIPQWTTFLLSAASYNFMVLFFALSLDYTSVGNSVILANSMALIMLIGKLFVGEHISFLEGGGALVAFGGAILCSKDSAAGENGSSSIWGDFLAILSALSGVGFLVFAKATRQHMPMGIFMFSTMVVGSVMIAVFQVYVMGEELTMDMNPRHGLWGFLAPQPDRLPLEIAIVVICSGIGRMGYVYSMQFFDNLVMSCVALLEPVLAVFIAFFLGVGALPGMEGWIGNVLVATGTYAVICKSGGEGH